MWTLTPYTRYSWISIICSFTLKWIFSSKKSQIRFTSSNTVNNKRAQHRSLHHLVVVVLKFICCVLYDQERNHWLRRQRRFRYCLDTASLTDRGLKSHYRFPRRELLQLIKELEAAVRGTRRAHAILPLTQVLVALMVIHSGFFQHVIADACGKLFPLRIASL